MTSGLALVRADFALLRLDPGWLEESHSASFKASFPGLPNQLRNVNNFPYILQSESYNSNWPELKIKELCQP